MSDCGTVLTIRRAGAADAERLADLGASTFRDAFAAENSPENMELYVSRAYGIPQQRAELANPGITTLVADIHGQLAGYAQLRANVVPECVTGSTPLELWRFYVAAPWHGRGVAHDLMNSVVMEARARQAQTLWLAVWERNERAKAFYRKCGFVDVGSQVFVLGNDVQSDRVMARSL